MTTFDNILFRLLRLLRGPSLPPYLSPTPHSYPVPDLCTMSGKYCNVITLVSPSPLPPLLPFFLPHRIR